MSVGAVTHVIFPSNIPFPSAFSRNGPRRFQDRELHLIKPSPNVALDVLIAAEPSW